MIVVLAVATACLLPPPASSVSADPGRIRHDGDSNSVSVKFSASGGTVTAGGLYTGGSTSGSFELVASIRSSDLADTVAVTVAADGGSPTASTATARATRAGVPFGAFSSWNGPVRRANTEAFTLSVTSVTPEELVERLTTGRATHHRFLLMMTGGAHRNYMTNGVFDMSKWKGWMDRYNTSALKTAVAAAVADGTIIGNAVMDEPQNTTAENTWGPAGTMTKARVDSMCGYVKAMFPTMPVGVVHDHRVFQPDVSYHRCDFIVSQYRWGKTKGDAAKFRDDALAVGQRDGIAIAFSLNILDGGIPRGRGDEHCPVPETGGDGTSGRACRMTADQIRDWGVVLGSAGCALTMWRYDPIFMADPKNIQAFKDVGTALSKAPGRSCGRQ